MANLRNGHMRMSFIALSSSFYSKVSIVMRWLGLNCYLLVLSLVTSLCPMGLYFTRNLAGREQLRTQVNVLRKYYKRYYFDG